MVRSGDRISGRYTSLDLNNDGIIDNCQQDQGISDVPAGIAGQFFLHNAQPNPFNPQTTIAFELPQPEAVSLRVFDVAGRLVKVLLDGEIVAEGRNRAVWNGRDSGGRLAASGIYFYRLEAGEFTETKKMMLLK